MYAEEGEEGAKQKKEKESQSKDENTYQKRQSKN